MTDIIVSKNVFEKHVNEEAKIFFKTKHTVYYKFNDSDILTLTTHSNRVGALGLTAPSRFLKFKKVYVNKNKVLVFDNVFFLSKFKLYDPTITNFRKNVNIDEAINYIKQNVDNRISLKIIKGLFDKKYESLIGFGPGLTPLGDDILSGVLLMEHYFKKDLVDKDHIIFISRKKTNDISYFQMKYAAEGLAPLPVKEYLSSSNKDDLLKMGATSGSGWLLGITYYFEFGGIADGLYNDKTEFVL
ncbi:hypothetical protein LN42_08960 [Marinitoga sp. 1137]|uniref:oxamate carbamoyltransferase subunit AllH family protein n=1 Tax=Marinitoga sp. 1137 TaxID=1545835 RepID=UPI0009504D21|nr:DUF2877 domain-containing protein [Marinitoga sp. 1137]APT76488.1 hypothetical protein LN42_08960 [Marinitoga sp. 1137]